MRADKGGFGMGLGVQGGAPVKVQPACYAGEGGVDGVEPFR